MAKPIQQARILAILYEMALAIGSEDRMQPLLQKTLQQLMYHTGFPCGAIFLGPIADEHEAPERQPIRLATSIGDYRLSRHNGNTLEVPHALLHGHAEMLTAPTLIDQLPVKPGSYTTLLRLPVPGHGVILLLAPEAVDSDIPLTEIFKPVLANFARALRLCQLSEAYTQRLLDDRDQAEAALLRFRAALDSSPDYVFLIDPQSMCFVDFNRSTEVQLGYRRDVLLEMGLQHLVPSTPPDEWQKYFHHLLTRRDGPDQLDAIIRCNDGGEFPVEFRLSLLERPDTAPLIIAIARNITERREAEEILAQEKERALVTLHSIGDAVITTDNQGRVEYLNPIAEALTGWSSAQASGRELAEVFHILNEYTREPVDSPVEIVLREGRIVGLANHTVLIDRAGVERAIEDSAAPIRDRRGQIIGVVLVFHDVSENRNLAKQLSWQSSHDPLTSLINRREFERRLQEALESAQQEQRHHVLLYLDLDQFKIINDTCGHWAGDELLKELGLLLQQQVLEKDVLARLGGDEFGLLLEDAGIDKAMRIAEHLRHKIADFRFSWEERNFDISVSIGLAPITERSEGLASVLSAADMACYAAKERGRNRLHLYHPNDQELVQRRDEMQRASQITQAIEQDRFRLYCQRIAPVGHHDGHDLHYEILLRLVENDEVLAPGVFIPAAERFNLMPAVDRWVIRTLFTLLGDYIRRLQQTGQGQKCLFAVNLSGASLGDERLFDYISEQLRLHAIPPEWICFEITETAAIGNLRQASWFIRRLRALGCRFSLDDFGSGLSSFAYLKNLPVDYLKIDGGFVRDMVEDPMDLAVVESINHIGHVMGKQTIAEFVETPAILEKLQEMGVDFAQGYGIERPHPLAPLLSAQSTRAKTSASSRPPAAG